MTPISGVEMTPNVVSRSLTPTRDSASDPRRPPVGGGVTVTPNILLYAAPPGRRSLKTPSKRSFEGVLREKPQKTNKNPSFFLIFIFSLKTPS
jgi:hypothetical protein